MFASVTQNARSFAACVTFAAFASPARLVVSVAPFLLIGRVGGDGAVLFIDLGQAGETVIRRTRSLLAKWQLCVSVLLLASMLGVCHGTVAQQRAGSERVDSQRREKLSLIGLWQALGAGRVARATEKSCLVTRPWAPGGKGPRFRVTRVIRVTTRNKSLAVNSLRR
jgi:hypothetical protein